MPDFLEEKRKEISQRLKELRPLVDEYHRLEAAEQALSGVGGTTTRPSPAAATTAPPRRPPQGLGAPAAAAARKGSGTRAVQALDLVKARPGITIPELAEAMGIKQNYLYRVMPGLAEEGKVTKSGVAGTKNRRTLAYQIESVCPRAKTEGDRPEPYRVDSLGDRVALLPELVHRRLDLLLREVVHLEVLHDRPLAARACAREARDQPLVDAVGAVGGHRHRDPVAVRRAVAPSRARGRRPRWRPTRRWRRRARR